MTATTILESDLPIRAETRRETFYAGVVATALGVIKTMNWKVNVTGAEHVPTSGPAIIAANHIGYLDFVFLGVAAHERRRFVRFMALQEAFDHWLGGPLLRGMRHIPVDRKGDATAALDRAIADLWAGEIVGVHPESRISRTLVPGKAKTGAARMALESGAPLIPAAVWGTQRLMPRGRRPKYPRGVAVTVELGPPVPVPSAIGCAELTDRLAAEIRRLVDEAIIAYPQRPPAPGSWWWPAHLGGSAPSREGSSISA